MTRAISTQQAFVFAGGTSVNRPGGGAASPASARRCRAGAGGGEQAPGFGDGERDHVRGRRAVAGPGAPGRVRRCRCGGGVGRR